MNRAWWSETVGPGHFVIFQRLIRFYNTFLVLCGLIASVSSGVLQFSEFHPTTSPAHRAAEGFFVSSTSMAVISGMLGTMLLFRFEDYNRASRYDLLLAWSPLVLLDWAILSFLAGLMIWYTSQNPGWRTYVMACTTSLGLSYSAWVAVDMFKVMRNPGGLGASGLGARSTNHQDGPTAQPWGMANKEEQLRKLSSIADSPSARGIQDNLRRPSST